MGDLRPHLVQEWAPHENGDLTPFDVKVSASYEAAWVCRVQTCGHTWRAPVYSRSRGAGCKKCRDRAISLRRSKPKPGESLGDAYPRIAQDWLPELNGGIAACEVAPHAGIQGVWKCKTCEHQWETSVSNRTRNDGEGSGCPDCWRRRHSQHMARVVDPANSIAVKAPDLAAEWDPDSPLNLDATPGTVMAKSRKRRGWKCREGHRWPASPDSRIGRGTGCSDCARGRESRQEVGMREYLCGRMPVAVRARVPRTDGGGRRPWLVDVLSVEAGVVVEFDGSWWHSERANPGMTAKDALKAADLRSQGLTVVRVREAPLEALHGHDLVVPLGLSGTEIGGRVWKHLLGLGVTAAWPEPLSA